MSILITERMNEVESLSLAAEGANIEIRADHLQHEVDEPASAAPPGKQPTPTGTVEEHSESRARVLASLLRMADIYQKAGSLRQALEMYFELVSEYSGTPQAGCAEERLLEVAHHYEQSGELHLARSIYEQLL